MLSRSLKAGQRVATIDLDSRQQSFTHYIDNRRAWAARARIKLELPTHYCIARAEGNSVEANEAQEFANFSAAISAIEHTHDVVVIDTPGADTYLMRLAHSMADTLVTPLNDSFLDFDVLATLDPTNFSVTGESHYAEMVREARRQRRLVDGQLTDWIVVRNRLSSSFVTQQAPGRRRHQRIVEAHGLPHASKALPSASFIANSSRAG